MLRGSRRDFGMGERFYIVSVGSGDKPHVLRFAEDPSRRFDPAKGGPEPHHLEFDKPGSVVLESDDPDHNYTLVFNAWDKNMEAGVEHHRKAELLKTDEKGTVSQRLSIYETAILETID